MYGNLGSVKRTKDVSRSLFLCLSWNEEKRGNFISFEKPQFWIMGAFHFQRIRYLGILKFRVLAYHLGFCCYFYFWVRVYMHKLSRGGSQNFLWNGSQEATIVGICFSITISQSSGWGLPRFQGELHIKFLSSKDLWRGLSYIYLVTQDHRDSPQCW